MNDLIDTTEMYLRTIFELEEEGIVPLRARIAERLHQFVGEGASAAARKGWVHADGRGRSGVAMDGLKSTAFTQLYDNRCPGDENRLLRALPQSVATRTGRL